MAIVVELSARLAIRYVIRWLRRQLFVGDPEGLLRQGQRDY